MEYARLETAKLRDIDDTYYYGAQCRQCGHGARLASGCAVRDAILAPSSSRSWLQTSEPGTWWSCLREIPAVNSGRARNSIPATSQKIATIHRYAARMEGPVMRLLIAFILPWLTFFTIGRPVAGIVCLILQCTLIGWIPATIWAVYALSQYTTDRKIEKALGQKGL